MNRFVLPLILSCLMVCRAFGQATPPTYPYAKPLPTSGATPAATIKTTGPINPPGYGDNRAAVWDDFMGGGYRIVKSTVERDQILTGRRKQGMWVKTVDDGRIYELATNLTSWVDLGYVRQYSFGGTNIYNSDGTLTTNRTVTGEGHDLTFTYINDLTLLATNMLFANAPRIVLTSNTTNGFVQIQSNTSTTNYYAFPYTNMVASGDDAIVFRSKEGYVKHTPPITYDEVVAAVAGGGTNIYNSDGDLTGDRTVNGDGNALTFSGNSNFSAAANTNISLAGGNAILLETPFFRHAPIVADSGVFVINNNSTMTNRYQFTGFNTIASGTDAVMFRDVSDPVGGIDGQVRYDPAITHAGILAAVSGGGTNIYNSNGSLTSDRTLNGNSKVLTFSGLTNFLVGANLMQVNAPNAIFLSTLFDVSSSSYTSIASGTNRIQVHSVMPALTPTYQAVFHDPVTGKLSWSDSYTVTNYTTRLNGYTVTTLPASPIQGDTAFVTDATAPTYLATVVGGGAVVAPVFYNGTDWVTH